MTQLITVILMITVILIPTKIKNKNDKKIIKNMYISMRLILNILEGLHNLLAKIYVSCTMENLYTSTLVRIIAPLVMVTS